MKMTKSAQGILSVLPVILILLFLKGYPFYTTIYESFRNWDGLYQNRFIGLSNYIDIFTNRDFWTMLFNNLILLLHIPLLLFAGLVLALLLYEETYGWKFFRSISFLPNIISVILIGYLFRMLFAPDGPVPMALGSLGIELEWLANRWSAMTVIILCMVWQSMGWQALLILGGLSSISVSVFEAAKIDGAGYWTRLFKIVLPLIVPIIEYSSILSVLMVFGNSFGYIFSITRGGPGYATTTLDYLVYSKAFVTGSQMGAASAVGVVLACIIFMATWAQMKIARKNDSGVE